MMDKEMVVSDTLVFTAPWILPVESEGIKDGAIAVQSGTICKVGISQKVLRKFPQARVIELDGVLLPPLINCHIHLELSHMRDMQRPGPGTGMVAWIEQIMQRRSQAEFTRQVIYNAMNDMIQEQYDSGVILMANIGNALHDFEQLNVNIPEIYSIHEVLAPNKQRTEQILTSLADFPDTLAVSPHAPYSSSADLICALKKRSVDNKQIMSIHLSESQDEIEFIRSKMGPFRKFLEDRESWDGSLFAEGLFSSGVEYLDALAVLDEHTLCVHCVHIDDKDIEILLQSKAKICLCPGSNTFLRVGRAPVEKLLSAGILPALGTDSLASNKELNMWREMQLLRDFSTKIKPQQILAMATKGGAMALHKDTCYGSLQKGKRGVFLEINYDDCSMLTEEETVVDKITSSGMPDKVSWIYPEKYSQEAVRE